MPDILLVETKEIRINKKESASFAVQVFAHGKFVKTYDKEAIGAIKQMMLADKCKISEEKKDFPAALANWAVVCLGRDASDKMNILIDTMKPIVLKNYEEAYIVEAYIKNQGLHDSIGVVMIRPSLNQVRDVSKWIHHFKVFDFNRDGISEVLGIKSNSHGGDENAVISVVQFDGWNPIVLRLAKYKGQDGDFPTLDNNHVDWQFFHVNGKIYLAETKKSKMQGRERDSFAVFAFSKGKFIEVSDPQLVHSIKLMTIADKSLLVRLDGS